MSAIVVSGDTSGAVTLNAPTVAGTVTVTLPSTTGTMLTTASTTGISGSAISSGTVAETYGGTGTTTGYYGFKNRIINGAMVIDQRNAGASTTITNATDFFITDRFKFYRDVGGTLTGQQSTTAPAGFVNSLLLTATSGVSPSAAQLNFFQQIIEGLNVGDLGWGTASAQTVTLSFWVRSSVTGTYSISLSNSALNRAYVATYTINAANTFEQKTITIAGDTSGTWLTTNGVGLRVYFDLGSGSNYNLTANAWGGTFGTRTSGSASWFATTGATFYITGVQLEKGATATSFDYRDYGRELMLCQRYFAKINASTTYTGFGSGLFASTGSAQIFLKYPTTMRSAPTISQSNCALNTTDVAFTVTSLSGTNAGTDTALQSFSIASGGTQYRAVVLTANNNTAAYVDFSSEL